MSALFDSVVTVLLITLLGWALMRFNAVTQEHWIGFERVSFHVFFPAIIIHSLIVADLSSVPAFRFGLSLLGAVVATGGLLLLARPVLARKIGLSDPAFSSVMQGAIRWNTFMGVSLAGLMHGARGLTLVAVAIVAIIPLMNIFTVLMLRRFGEGHSGSLSPVDLLKNPFVWSSLAGLFLNFTGIRPPQAVLAAIDICGKAALATALLLVGSGLRLGDLGKPGVALFLSSGTKLLFIPALAAAFGYLAGLGGMETSVLLICASVPTAGAAYIMARQMGGDARLMAAIITFETIACLATIPLVQWLFVRP
jgi:predicted permease